MTEAQQQSQASITSTEAPVQQSQQRQFDIVLYGATSFVGQLVAAYLQRFLTDVNDNNQQSVRWAIAGRNQDKLNQVKKDIGNPDIETIIADSEDATSLDQMTAQTKVIISTVGPYLKYGEPLIKACVNNGTDYVDLTGEAIFIKDMMDAYQDKARQTGARIVNACGFDSIPSDLGVLFTQNCAKKDFGEYCEHIKMRVKAAKGGLSGGTVASMATIFEAIGKDKHRRKQLANPYLLNDDSQRPNARQIELKKPEWDERNNRWLAPFIMASINTRVVHRSNQLKDYQYGREFRYDEAMWMPAGVKGRVLSYGLTAAMAGFAAGMMFKPSRDLLNERVLPKSGDGPSESEQQNGYFDIRFFGALASDKQSQVLTKVTGDKDPGYGSTCQMLSQSALCLLQDISKDEVGGGFWTPASAMGETLIERLQQHAGLKFEQISA
ncbi:saccharopine dehydrogenase family protein [Psychrobacter sp. FDAARGOS_221]|uniref:saccharopine dehydrogenase family protein n=1 Tax=Psychrobacter sp. FDAARGOS_221 TaxID=1975705 RepID=UPI000BB55314|nr:saccharopine dehydrogenase NADP-binding domain-containing protein [Psychrobacter sp. FDAARGOS_221]PNK61036.1 saccharopine dehydrogenase [Psychrobacter sp. FDAARGOS_221]